MVRLLLHRDVSSYVKVLTCSFITAKYNPLGSAMLGAASHDQFGYSVSMPSDGKTIDSGDQHSNCSRNSSGNAKVLT